MKNYNQIGMNRLLRKSVRMDPYIWARAKELRIDVPTLLRTTLEKAVFLKENELREKQLAEQDRVARERLAQSSPPRTRSPRG